MTGQPKTTVERLVDAARAAVRCRQAADETPHAAEDLKRAADRFSRRVTELANVLADAQK